MILALTILIRACTSDLIVTKDASVVLPCSYAHTELITQISWQRVTKGIPLRDNFYTILYSGEVTNIEHDYRFKYIGNVKASDGSIVLSNVTLLDEGNYTCIVTLFPSGDHRLNVPLVVHVPPLMYVKDNQPMLGNEMHLLATCTAAGSKPTATIEWLTGPLKDKVKMTTNYTHHENGTTTTVGMLYGVPNKDVNLRAVQCKISGPSLSKDEIIPFEILVHSEPVNVTITVGPENAIRCISDGNPSPTITWTKGGQSWPESGVRVNGSTVQFLSTSPELNGIYQCEAANVYGVRYTSVDLMLRSPNLPFHDPLWPLYLPLIVLTVMCAATVCYYKLRRLKTYGTGSGPHV